MDPITSDQYEEAENWEIRQLGECDYVLVRLGFPVQIMAHFYGPNAFVRAVRVLWCVKEAVYDGNHPALCLTLFRDILGTSSQWPQVHGNI